MVAPAGAPLFVDNKGAAEVRWATVSSGRSYGWIEPRAAYVGIVESPTRSGVVKRWQIPIRIGDSSSRIEGVTEWFPIEPVAEKL